MEPTISLNEAAERLGVHYMTAYRYVRTGRLDARKVGGTWQVPVAAIEHFGAVAEDAGTHSIDRGHRLEQRLLASDEVGAWDIVESALTSGLDAREVHLEVISPALVSIGERWSRGEISIADEHRATAVVTRILARLGPRFTRPGRRRGTVVLGAPAMDHHSLPSAMAADLLRERGFDVIDLGANTPAESFLDAARSSDAVFAIGVAITTTDNQTSVRSLLNTLNLEGDLPVVVGGNAQFDAAELRRWGASVVSDSVESMLEAFEAILAERASERSAASGS